jgi:RES domain-containing protein
MVTLWRIAKARHASTVFDGEGARLNGGRWNSVGVRVAYASQSIALASLEVLVGLQKSRFLPAYSVVSAQVDEAGVEDLPSVALPANWRSHPPSPESQAIGDLWIREQRSLALRVPSAIIDGEFNYLLNPAHPDFGSVTISPPAPFAFDPRLVAMLRKS